MFWATGTVLGKSPDMGPSLACSRITRRSGESGAKSWEMATFKVSFPRVFGTLKDSGYFALKEIKTTGMVYAQK